MTPKEYKGWTVRQTGSEVSIYKSGIELNGLSWKEARETIDLMERGNSRGWKQKLEEHV